ncbi:MAG: apolipoprotein N-acyltransferase [Ahrensia sp.]|nr:apolipoprotein N-acyltransferase [Ahrensia sp.]
MLTREPGAVAAIADMLQIGQNLIAGVVREEQSPEGNSEAQRYYNSMLVIDSDGIITAAADKTHLVPFGEYLPFKDQLSALGLRAIAAADRGYVPGSQRRSLALPGGITALPLICYEVIFGHEVQRLAPSDGLIVNVTNDAWYGNTPGPYQHLHQSQLRAVELGQPLVRGANSGISAMIDAKGRITHRLALNERGAFDAVLTGKMPETLGKAEGPTIFWLIILFFTTIGLISRSRQ